MSKKPGQHQIHDTLKLHHEVMAEMAASESDNDLREWLRLGEEAERAARSLEGLGLLDRSSEQWTRSPTLKSLQALKRPRTTSLEALRISRSQSFDLRSLVSQPEGPQLEFKSTARVNLRTGKPDDAMKRAVVKTVAGFANTLGGSLLIGVSDSGEIVGIEDDLVTCNGSRDTYELYIRDSLRQALGPGFVSNHVGISIAAVDGQAICKVTVTPSEDGLWCDYKDQDVFFVRNGNQTVTLRNREVADYLDRRLNV